LGDTPKRVSPYVRDPHLDPNLGSILLSPLRIPSESGMAITPHPLIGFASEYMRWKALLRGFPLDGVLSTTTRDSIAYGGVRLRDLVAIVCVVSGLSLMRLGPSYVFLY
jgi:hypothetical protein